MRTGPGEGPRWRSAPRRPRRSRYLAGLHAENAQARHQDDGPGGPRTALEHGRRHADAGARPAGSAARRPPAPVVRPGHEPADRPRARTGGDGSAGRAGTAVRAARRSAARSAHAPPQAAVPRGPARAAARVPGRGPPARCHVGPHRGPAGLAEALHRLGADSVVAASGRSELLVLSDRAFGPDQLPIPSVLAVGAVHSALTGAGLGAGRTSWPRPPTSSTPTPAMALAGGATAVNPWLAVEAAAELAGTRGAEGSMRPRPGQPPRRLDAGLRKTLARMGISTVASYIGGGLFDTIELGPSVGARCFPAAAAWPGPGRVRGPRPAAAPAPGGISIASLRRPPRTRLPDPGFARFRADGEVHRYAPKIVARDPGVWAWTRRERAGRGFIAALAAYRDSAGATPPSSATTAPDPPPRGIGPIPVAAVEPARAIARRFVVQRDDASVPCRRRRTRH